MTLPPERRARRQVHLHGRLPCTSIRPAAQRRRHSRQAPRRPVTYRAHPVYLRPDQAGETNARHRRRGLAATALHNRRPVDGPRSSSGGYILQRRGGCTVLSKTSRSSPVPRRDQKPLGQPVALPDRIREPARAHQTRRQTRRAGFADGHAGCQLADGARLSGNGSPSPCACRALAGGSSSPSPRSKAQRAVIRCSGSIAPRCGRPDSARPWAASRPAPRRFMGRSGLPLG